MPNALPKQPRDGNKKPHVVPPTVTRDLTELPALVADALSA